MQFRRGTHTEQPRTPLGRYAAYFAAGGLSNGFTLSVSTLLLLARGLSLVQVSLAVALQSLVSVALEMPSGMAGDLWGRKKVWLASRAAFAVSLGLYLAASGPLVFLAVLCNGVSNALASGTVDAMFYDAWLADRGQGTLSKANLLRTALSTGGTALGALAGGLLSGVAFLRPYTANLLAVAAAQALCLAAVLALPGDTARKAPGAGGSGGRMAAALAALAGQAKDTGRAALESPGLLISLSGAVLLGFVIPGPQLYWQPRLEELAGGAGLGVLLGVLSCVSQLGAIAGSLLNVQLAKAVKSPMACYFLSRLALLGALTGLARAGSTAALAAWFVAYYLLLGMHAGADDVLLQAGAAGGVRGSVIGMQNLLTYAGITAAQLAAAALVETGIPFLWGVQAAVLAGGTVLCGAWYLGARWGVRAAERGGRPAAAPEPDNTNRIKCTK